MGVEPWDPQQLQRYVRAIDEAWDEFESTYYATVKRAGLNTPAATHAATYMRKARLVRDFAKGMLAKPTRSDETPEAVRNAVAELTNLKRQLNNV